MAEVLNTILLVIAGLSFLGAIFYIVAGLLARSEASGSPYGVKRQEARQGMIVSFMRGVFFISLSLIIFAILGISNLPEGSKAVEIKEGEPNLILSPTETISQPTGLSTPRSPESSPTSPVATLTATATWTPIPTETPVIIIAQVNSPNGLWLREKPGGDQELELIADGLEIVVLEGTEIADDLEWRRVRTQSGKEGWVAVAFIVFP